MASVRPRDKAAGRRHHRHHVRHEPAGVEIRDLAPEALADELARLETPWIAEEGPLHANFRAWPPGAGTSELGPRGIAFDATTTVVWDEVSVRAIRATEKPSAGVLARRSTVRLRARFHERTCLPETVERIDYLAHGVLLASRYIPGASRPEAIPKEDAHA